MVNQDSSLGQLYDMRNFLSCSLTGNQEILDFKIFHSFMSVGS